MRIKLTTNYGGKNYMTVSDYSIRKYDAIGSFWYFSFNTFFSYADNFEYKFNSEKAVEKLIEDIYNEDSMGTVIYDVDAKLMQLGIVKNKETGLFELN